MRKPVVDRLEVVDVAERNPPVAAARVLHDFAYPSIDTPPVHQAREPIFQRKLALMISLQSSLLDAPLCSDRARLPLDLYSPDRPLDGASCAQAAQRSTSVTERFVHVGLDAQNPGVFVSHTHLFEPCEGPLQWRQRFIVSAEAEQALASRRENECHDCRIVEVDRAGQFAVDQRQCILEPALHEQDFHSRAETEKASATAPRFAGNAFRGVVAARTRQADGLLGV